MRKFLATAIVCFVLSINLLAVNTTVTMQAQWNALGTSIPAGDTVTVAVGANIMNTTVPGIALQGVLINNGTFSMNMAGAGIAAIGAIINYGTFVVNQGLDVIGMFINVGTLNVTGAAIVVQSGGRLYNTGTISNQIDVFNNGGTVANCGTISGNPVSGGGINGVVPNGTSCNDGDPNTSNDVITLGRTCACAGMAPIPTMSEWGLIILSISLMIAGLIAIKQWGFTKKMA